MLPPPMKPFLAVFVLIAALAGCGSGSETSAIPSGGETTTAATTTSETTAAPAPAGCKSVKEPKPKPDGGLKKPATKLDAKKTWTATVTTNCGTFAFRLDVKNAPNVSASIAYLAGKKFYDG